MFQVCVQACSSLCKLNSNVIMNSRTYVKVAQPVNRRVPIVKKKISPYHECFYKWPPVSLYSKYLHPRYSFQSLEKAIFQLEVTDTANVIAKVNNEL